MLLFGLFMLLEEFGILMFLIKYKFIRLTITINEILADFVCRSFCLPTT